MCVCLCVPYYYGCCAHRVSAHFVEQPSKESSKPTTTILIKFDASVMQRQAAMDAAKRGL